MKTLDMREMGELFRTFRKAQHLTQFQLAEAIEIDEKQLGKIERGVHYPSVTTFLKLIKALNIDVNKFYSGFNINPKEQQLTQLIAKLTPKEIEKTFKILQIAFEN